MARHRTPRTTEDHLALGLPVLFSELLVFKWTPLSGFPVVSEEFRMKFERMQEVENLENELRVFFQSFDGALDALERSDVRKNTFKFLDQYGTIDDILKTEVLRQSSATRSLVPEYLEERIRRLEKWYRTEDDFSLVFAREFLRRKYCTMRSSFRAPQPQSLLPPVPPPRRHRSGGQIQDTRPSPGPSGYTASGRPRRNSAPATNHGPAKPRRLTAEELPSPPPTPPPLQSPVHEVPTNARQAAPSSPEQSPVVEQRVNVQVVDQAVLEESQEDVQLDEADEIPNADDHVVPASPPAAPLNDDVLPTTAVENRIEVPGEVEEEDDCPLSPPTISHESNNNDSKIHEQQVVTGDSKLGQQHAFREIEAAAERPMQETAM